MSGQKSTIEYLRPREKAVRNGISALNDRELIQIVVGSGTVKHSVARISKRILTLLSHYGSNISYEQLLALPGLGTARSLQLLALFELASRYPTSLKSPPLTTTELITQQIKSPSPSGRLWVITMDGAKRLISQRTLLVSDGPRAILREATNFMIHDNATHIALVRYLDRLVPSMSDLSIARDIYRISLLLGVSSVDYILYNDTDQHSIIKEATYAS